MSKHFKKSLWLGPCLAVLTGCATSGLSIKPIEAQGKALTKASTLIGSDADSYIETSRRSLLVFSEEAGVGGIPVNEFRATTQSTPYTKDHVAQYLICNPLLAGNDLHNNAGALSQLGQSLGKVAAASPETLIGLLGTLNKDYTVAMPSGEVAKKDRAALDMACKQRVEQALAIETGAIKPIKDPDMIELVNVNGYAFRTGNADGPGETAGFEAVSALVVAIGDVAKGFLKQADQGKRNKALKEFFSKEENIESIHTQVKGLDHGIYVVSLGERVQAKTEFSDAWKAYRSAVSNGASPKEKNEARDALLKSTAALDKIIRLDFAAHKAAPGQLLSVYTMKHSDPSLATAYFKTRDKLAKLDDQESDTALDLKKQKEKLEAKLGDELARAQTTYSQYAADAKALAAMKLTPPGYIQTKCATVGVSERCLKTSAAQALHTSIEQTKIVATGDFDKMTDAQKTAYWESIFATLGEIRTLNKNLAAFENDKTSFVLLQDVLGSF